MFIDSLYYIVIGIFINQLINLVIRLVKKEKLTKHFTFPLLFQLAFCLIYSLDSSFFGKQGIIVENVFGLGYIAFLVLIHFFEKGKVVF